MVAINSVVLSTKFILIINALGALANSKLPSSFQQCSKSDPNFNTCLKTAIETAFKAMKNGIPSVQLLPIDPLAITQISIQEGGNRPVNVKIDLSNAQLSGLNTIQVKESRSDVHKRYFDLDVSVPGLELEGDYVMDGRFLLVPLQGKGKCHMTLTKFNANIKIQADIKTTNGEEYWDLTSFIIKITDVSNFKVNFENLFNGDKVLGDSTNKVLNENWQGFWEELRPAMQDTFAEVFSKVGNVIFSKVPEKDLFLD